MVSDALRSLLGREDLVGELDGDDVATGSADHPVCGDRVELSVRVADAGDGPIVRAVRWRASGCPASMAVAALCADALVDVPQADLEPTLRRALERVGGLARHEQHAEAMALRALDDALRACAGRRSG